MKISTLGNFGIRLVMSFCAAVIDTGSKGSPAQRKAAQNLLLAAQDLVDTFSTL